MLIRLVLWLRTPRTLQEGKLMWFSIRNFTPLPQEGLAQKPRSGVQP